MKVLSTVLSSLLIATSCFGQQEPASTATAPAAPAPEQQDEPKVIRPAVGAQLKPYIHDALPEADPQTVELARIVLRDSAERYREALTLTDHLYCDYDSSFGPAVVEIDFKLGRGTDAYLKVGPTELASIGDRFYVVDERIENRYVEIPLEVDFPTSYRKIQGTQNNLPPHFAIRTAETLPEYLRAFSWGMLTNERVAGYDLIERENGKRLHEVLIAGDLANMTVEIDPDTKLVRRMVLAGTFEGMPEDFHMVEKIAFDTKFHTELPSPIDVDPGSREAVATPEELVARPEQETEDASAPASTATAAPVAPEPVPAPAFTLTTLDGEEVSLEALRGNVVVLDFWATWCLPCRRGLPLLAEFARWVDESGHPVKVFAVDCMERGSSREQIADKVRSFWTQQGFEFPTLMDWDSSVARAYRVTEIPRTIVIAPDGNIHTIHRGANPNMVRMLQQDVETILNADS